MSVFPGPVTWAVTSRVSPSSFLKLAPVYCLSVFLLRCSGKAGGLAARGPFSGLGRGWGGTRSAASPAKVRLCSGEALGVFTPSPPPAAGGSGTLLGSSPEKPATGRVLGPQDVPTVARAHAGRQQPLISPRGPHGRRARRMRPGDRLSRSRLRLCLSLQISGWRLALQPRSSGGSEKSHRFSVCPAFPPVVRTGVTISSSHASELKREPDGFFSPRFAQFCHPRQDAGSWGWRSLAHDL